MALISDTGQDGKTTRIFTTPEARRYIELLELFRRSSVF
jgi:hypothetical protein